MWKITLLAILIALPYSYQADSDLKAGCPKYIGTAPDGRLYFLDNSTYLSWYEARDLCQECGYEMAEINSREQSNFLGSLLWEDENRQYWTSARESRDHINFFSWDASNRHIEDVFDYAVDGTGGPSFTPFTVCGQLQLKLDYPPDAWIVAKPCKNGHFTLCMLN